MDGREKDFSKIRFYDIHRVVPGVLFTPRWFVEQHTHTHTPKQWCDGIVVMVWRFTSIIE